MMVMALLQLVAGCARTSKESTRAKGKVRVFVSIPPQAFLVERLAGPHANVEVLVGSGRSPVTYQATSRQMAKLAGAALYLRIGVPFERVLLKKIRAINSKVKIVNTLGEGKHFPSTCSHGAAHGEEGLDPHSWLDPRAAARQAAIICKELIKLDPSRTGYYRKNLKRLLGDIIKVEARIFRIMAKVKGAKFFVYHPAYGHFAKRFGLRQVAIEQNGRKPGGQYLVALIEEARKLKVKDIFVQLQFSKRTARTVARALGGRVIFLDPLARDYLNNLMRMARKIKKALSAVR